MANIIEINEITYPFTQPNSPPTKRITPKATKQAVLEESCIFPFIATKVPKQIKNIVSKVN